MKKLGWREKVGWSKGRRRGRENRQERGREDRQEREGRD